MPLSPPLILERTAGAAASSPQRREKGEFEHYDHRPRHSLSCSSSSTSWSADDDSTTRNSRRGGNVLLTFPFQLHSMLQAAGNEGFDHIVSWLDDNASFKVHEPALFVKQVLPRFFERQSKYKSFQRQLNLWQFDRLIGSRGPSNGGYCRANFHRTHTADFHLIKRLTKLRSFDTETFMQVFPGFICHGDGNDSTNKNGMLDEDDLLVQGSLIPRTEATRHQKKEPDMIISQDEWKYVLVGLRIGAGMASA